MNKPTVYEALKAKLGREPTHIEIVRDVQRIFREAREEPLDPPGWEGGFADNH